MQEIRWMKLRHLGHTPYHSGKQEPKAYSSQPGQQRRVILKTNLGRQRCLPFKIRRQRLYPLAINALSIDTKRISNRKQRTKFY